MAVTEVELVGSVGADIKVGGQSSYDVLYRVHTNSRSDQVQALLRAAGMPQPGTYYTCGTDIDVAAFVSGYTPRLVASEHDGKTWEVVVHYSSAGSSADPNNNQGTYPEAPWLAPARISGAGTKTDEPARWHFPNPDSAESIAVLTNSAGAYFDDEYRDVSHLGISIARAYAMQDFDEAVFASYADCVNDDDFFGMPRDYYKLATPRWQVLYTGEGVAYVDVQFEFEGHRDGWNEVDRPEPARKIDEGYYYIDYATGTPVMKRFADDLFRPISGKGRLDGAGGALPWTDPPAHYPPEGVNKYLRVDFADLQIPTKLPTK